MLDMFTIFNKSVCSCLFHCSKGLCVQWNLAWHRSCIFNMLWQSSKNYKKNNYHGKMNIFVKNSDDCGCSVWGIQKNPIWWLQNWCFVKLNYRKKVFFPHPFICQTTQYSTFKTDIIKVSLVFSISNFFLTKMSLVNKLMRKIIPSCSNSALATLGRNRVYYPNCS